MREGFSFCWKKMDRENEEDAGILNEEDAEMTDPQQRNASKPSRKWVKQWVPQDTVLNNGKCFLSKWITEESWKAMKERVQEEEQPLEPEYEVVFLCNTEGCGQTFTEASAMMKHSQLHVQKLCPYEGCGKKFLDLAKLRRHMVSHETDNHVFCTVEGCGKLFPSEMSFHQDMKSHKDNYHTCPYDECGKRYAYESKLRTHIKTHHGKAMLTDLKPSLQVERECPNAQNAASNVGTATPDRPFSCPYEGCNKFYKHAYKLKLHLRREHADYRLEENGKNMSNNIPQDEVGIGNEHDGKMGKAVVTNNLGRGKLIVSNTSATSGTKRKHTNAMTNDLIVRSNYNKSLVRGGYFAGQDSSEDDSEKTEEDTEGEGRGKTMAAMTDEEDDEETEDERS